MEPKKNPVQVKKYVSGSKNLNPEVILIGDDDKGSDEASPAGAEKKSSSPARVEQTCHQCRQKSPGLVAQCKTCRLKYCVKCLLNRYGEQAAVVNDLKSWSCPKCRGICNCSLCMKKKGYKPTGDLTHLAKAKGFASVAEFLTQEAKEGRHPSQLAAKLEAEAKNCKKTESGTQEPEANSAQTKQRKGGEGGTTTKRKTKKPKVSEPGETSAGAASKTKKKNNQDGEPEASQEPGKTSRPSLQQLRKRKRGIDASMIEETQADDAPEVNTLVQDELATKKLKKPGNPKPKKEKMLEEKGAVAESGHLQEEEEQNEIVENVEEPEEGQVLLPPGVELTSVAGHQLSQLFIGPALQMLEFCTTFRKMLFLKLKHGEAVLNEMISGVSRRNSSLVQLHMKLLSYLRSDSDDKSDTKQARKHSWMVAFKDHLQKRARFFEDSSHSEIIIQALESGIDGYESLEVHLKLLMLNILCDDCLSTLPFRNHMQTKISRKANKEEKTQIASADKENEAENLKEENEAPEARKSSSQITRTETLRTIPLAVAPDGRFFWNLKSIDEPSTIVLQGASDPSLPQEKWCFYSAEDEEILHKYIAAERVKKFLARRRKPTPVAAAAPAPPMVINLEVVI